MKRLILFGVVVLLCAPYADAQLWKMKRYEATAGLGTSQFYGDVGGYTIGQNALGLKDITFRQTRFNINGSFRYFVYDNLAARLSLSYIMLHATDVRGSNEDRRYESVTSLFEPALIGEYYFVRNRERNSFLFQTYRGRTRNRLKDFFRSIDVNPNDALAARDMPTSGFTGIIPVGLGAKLAFDPNILFGVELIGRYAFSDYLDGYTSQWSVRNDVYHTFSVTFNYRIRTARNGLPAFRQSFR
jgi:hypothetical protein